MDNDPNGVTWLPAWKRHGYESREAYDKAQWSYSHWPQEHPTGTSPPPKSTKGTRGPDNPFWTGGRKVDKQGYVLIWLPAEHRLHCMTNSQNYVREHRLVMAEWLGRPLTAEEVVHHVNGVVDDNRIENLDLLPHASSHIKLHAELRRPTHCPAGHEYTDENSGQSSGYRACKTCMKEREDKRTAKRSAERAARRKARGWKPWPQKRPPPYPADDEDDA